MVHAGKVYTRYTCIDTKYQIAVHVCVHVCVRVYLVGALTHSKSIAQRNALSQ